jgi:hypothetical protein
LTGSGAGPSGCRPVGARSELIFPVGRPVWLRSNEFFLRELAESNCEAACEETELILRDGNRGSAAGNGVAGLGRSLLGQRRPGESGAAAWGARCAWWPRARAMVGRPERLRRGVGLAWACAERRNHSENGDGAVACADAWVAKGEWSLS